MPNVDIVCVSAASVTRAAYKYDRRGVRDEVSSAQAGTWGAIAPVFYSVPYGGRAGLVGARNEVISLLLIRWCPGSCPVSGGGDLGTG